MPSTPSVETSSETSAASASGTTRSVLARSYLLHTRESWVPTPMPGLSRGMAVMHACPALGADFLCFTAELEPGGTLRLPAENCFVFPLRGTLSLALHGKETFLGDDQFAFCAAADSATLTADSLSAESVEVLVIAKRYEPLEGVTPPASFVGSQNEGAAVPLNGDANVMVTALLPPGVEFDFAVNLMTFAPGASLGQVEVHHMEHGLMMLFGSGTYVLDGDTHAVRYPDFIWMAPFCPQWFQADSASPARYLIYKNFNRVPKL